MRKKRGLGKIVLLKNGKKWFMKPERRGASYSTEARDSRGV
jgi:hypothetical protein